MVIYEVTEYWQFEQLYDVCRDTIYITGTGYHQFIRNYFCLPLDIMKIFIEDIEAQLVVWQSELSITYWLIFPISVDLSNYNKREVSLDDIRN